MEKYTLQPKKIDCPICSSFNGLVLYTVDSEQAAQHFVLNEVDLDRHRRLRGHIEALWAQSMCDIVRCTGCGFCFADPFVAGDARFYDLAYQRSSYPQWKWEYERTRESFTDLKGRGELDGARLLEVGAGNGAFIRQVTPDFVPKENVLCTEFSDFGRDAIAEYGVKCIPQDVRELIPEGDAARFDVICMFQVLEHLDQLDALFAHLSSIASNTAHLFIAVPNAKRIEFNELHGSLLDMPPNHVGRWNRTSFEVIGRRHGWNLAEYDVQRESSRAKARQFAFYRYGRKSQLRYTLANQLERITPKLVRRPLQALAVGWYALTALPGFYSLLSDTELGEAQWVHMVKRTPADEQ